MRRIIRTINNTVRVVRLLSNPRLMEILDTELQKRSKNITPRLGQNDILYHKHYLIQIVN